MRATPHFYILRAGPERYQAEPYEKNSFLKIGNMGETHKFYTEKPYRTFVRKHQMADMIWASELPWKLLISDRLRRIFEDAGVRGYEAIAADTKLIFEHTKEESIFWLVAITGWGGCASKLSGIKRFPDPRTPHAYRGVTDSSKLIDIELWDGSDMFLVWPMTSFLFITDKLIALLRSHKIAHYSVYPLEEYFDGDGPWYPSPLSCYYSAERAEEIGQQLGISMW